ncbi:MAG: GNAT family N-acetyltransferase [Yoonia sp.]|nr:GNAT family N-acetyltransferase [Yoonia sp.]
MTVLPATAPILCRMAMSADDVAACQALRYACFHGGTGLDADQFDVLSDHVMVERDGVLVCTLRLRVLPDGADFSGTYTGGFYDFGPLKGPTLEVGRFCVAQGAFSSDVLRLAWAAITQRVDACNISHLFGCASFAGTNPVAYADAFGVLQAKHLGRIKIAPKATDNKKLSEINSADHDPRLALQQMPPLLRSYLGMGGYVSDHLIVDHTLGTLHVFTGLDIATIPVARARSLRALAAQTEGLHMGPLRTT